MCIIDKNYFVYVLKLSLFVMVGLNILKIVMLFDKLHNLFELLNLPKVRTC